MISDIARLVLGLSSDGVRLEKLGSGSDGIGANIETKKDVCLSLLMSSLLANGLESLVDLEANPLEFVSGIHKVPFCGCYLPSSMVGVLISVNKYLILACAYPGLLPVVDLQIVTLERYLSYWTSAKKMGLLTCKENIKFDGVYENWPVFCIEMTGILIKYRIL